MAPMSAERPGKPLIHTAPGALPVDELLPQDVRVPAVLGELAQHVEVHPAQRERAAPVTADDVIQSQGRGRAARGLACLAVGLLDGGDGVAVLQDERLVRGRGDADLGTGPRLGRFRHGAPVVMMHMSCCEALCCTPETR